MITTHFCSGEMNSLVVSPSSLEVAQTEARHLGWVLEGEGQGRRMSSGPGSGRSTGGL